MQNKIEQKIYLNMILLGNSSLCYPQFCYAKCKSLDEAFVVFVDFHKLDHLEHVGWQGIIELCFFGELNFAQVNFKVLIDSHKVLGN
jgi:hypothetical protein